MVGINDFVNLIANIGFPIAVSAYLIYLRQYL
ncbi:YvrJ family protein [Clostridium polyendosporum]|nr:YvrJ family protein [Clostridium polyendosporum]